MLAVAVMRGVGAGMIEGFGWLKICCFFGVQDGIYREDLVPLERKDTPGLLVFMR